MTPRIITADEARELLHGATEGPWEVGVASSWQGSVRIETEMYVRRPGDNVALAAQVIDPRTEEISESNARLLAAAPDLAATVIAQAAEIASIRASIDGRTTPPTDEEIRSAALAGLTVILHATEACDGHRVDLRTRDVLVLSTWAAHHADGHFASATWRLIDANDRPCAWPVVAEVSP